MTLEEMARNLELKHLNKTINGLTEIWEMNKDLSSDDKFVLQLALDYMERYKDCLGRERTDHEKVEERSEAQRERAVMSDSPERGADPGLYGINISSLDNKTEVLDGSIEISQRSSVPDVIELEIFKKDEFDKKYVIGALLTVDEFNQLVDQMLMLQRDIQR